MKNKVFKKVSKKPKLIREATEAYTQAKNSN